MTVSRAGELESNTNMRPQCGHIHFVRVGCLCVLVYNVCVCVHERMYVCIAANCVILGHCVFCQGCD